MKNKLLAVIALILAFILGACSVSEAKADQILPLKIWYQNGNGAYHTRVVVDDDTGVNYVVVAGRYSNGLAPEAIGITPRLKADGTLYVSE